MLPNDRRATIEEARSRIAELDAAAGDLHATVDELIRIIESVTPSGMLGSILILDDEHRHLLHGAAPSLPADYNDAINGIEIGPEVGSCGTAAFHDRTVSVFDIANDPLWANFKDLAINHGLRACWSTPIHASDGSVIGTFANYYRVVRDPSPVDEELTATITGTAARIIEQHRRPASHSRTLTG